MLANLLALAILGALVLYLLTGGADFGGGVWDLLARGPRADAQRARIDRALAPVWEANHVWLILVVVLLFGAFPPAFSALATGLHLPLTALLVGIVFRGSAFVFRKYGGGGRASTRRWGLVFAIASLLSPICLGVTLGAVTEGTIRVVDGLPTGAYLWAWVTPFALCVGALTLAICAHLAAVYLAVEAQDDRDLASDFRARALASGVAVGALAWLTRFIGPVAPHVVLDVLTAGAALVALAALWTRRYGVARVLVVAQVASILVGWADAQHPHLIAPDVTIASAAAPPATLRLLGPALLTGALVLFPSLYWLMRVFKQGPSGPSSDEARRASPPQR